MDMSSLKAGDLFLFVGNQISTRVVKKVGRKWITSNFGERFDKKSGVPEHRNGSTWPNLAAYEEAVRRNKRWTELAKVIGKARTPTDSFMDELEDLLAKHLVL